MMHSGMTKQAVFLFLFVCVYDISNEMSLDLYLD